MQHVKNRVEEKLDQALACLGLSPGPSPMTPDSVNNLPPLVCADSGHSNGTCIPAVHWRWNKMIQEMLNTWHVISVQ